MIVCRYSKNGGFRDVYKSEKTNRWHLSQIVNKAIADAAGELPLPEKETLDYGFYDRRTLCKALTLQGWKLQKSFNHQTWRKGK